MPLGAQTPGVRRSRPRQADASVENATFPGRVDATGRQFPASHWGNFYKRNNLNPSPASGNAKRRRPARARARKEEPFPFSRFYLSDLTLGAAARGRARRGPVLSENVVFLRKC
ncbi:hypothetical protein EVAR_5067_1 [Eumeta japonica]|uniref:Uncharacterized protein n=1 Tax=Eumeta variegata TaxID=151549 RepID=A0A4C1SV20_EUMVA|nr:hypothetical protein EVAR_5067_1 [Eumeta japonica]